MIAAFFIVWLGIALLLISLGAVLGSAGMLLGAWRLEGIGATIGLFGATVLAAGLFAMVIGFFGYAAFIGEWP